jgi:hypothetical protein
MTQQQWESYIQWEDDPMRHQRPPPPSDPVAARKQRKAYAKDFSGNGPVEICVSKVELRKEIDGDRAPSDMVYVLVDIGAYNDGIDTNHVSPIDFTLSTPDGYTVPYSSETYSLSRKFEGVDLRYHQQAGGWLAFRAPKADEYKLNFDGRGRCQVPVVP